MGLVETFAGSFFKSKLAQNGSQFVENARDEKILLKIFCKRTVFSVFVTIIIFDVKELLHRSLCKL